MNHSQWKSMSLKENSANLRDENLLTGKTEVRIVTSAINLNIFFENVFRINARINHYRTTIIIKLLQ